MKKSRVRTMISRTGLVISLLLVLVNAGVFMSQAQTADTPLWTTPLNLSQSGGAGAPKILVDSEGNLHVFWNDEYGGYMYRTGNGETWGDPQEILVPFEGDESKLELRLTPNGRLTAVWIDEDEQLFTSTTRLNSIENPASWSRPIFWGLDIRDIAVEVDGAGGLQVAYLRGETGENLPAGIYAIRSVNGDGIWSTPRLVYASPYLRGIESGDSHLSISSTATESETLVYLAWDHRTRRSLWFARSDDGGSTWGQPKELVHPTPEFGFDLPYEMQINAFGEQVLAVWKLGIVGDRCNTYSMKTTDRGETWSVPQLIFDPVEGCPGEVAFINPGEENLILFTRINTQAYLLAWNAVEWSAPQYEATLSTLYDNEAERSFTFLDLSTVKFGSRLFLVGNTSAEEGGDVWMLARTLEDQPAWFPSLTSWKAPELINPIRLDPVPVVRLVSDSQGIQHVLWNVVSGSGVDQEAAVYYARRDGEAWSLPARILAFEEANTFLHSVAISSDDTIYVALERKTRQGISEGLFVSYASTAEASSFDGWITSEALPTLYLTATSPVIQIVGDNQIRIFFVLPLNEDRGVYALTSSDSGRTWDGPNLVVDAASQGWEMVGDPQFAVSGSGQEIVVTWTNYTLPPYSQPVGLYGSVSFDGGGAWDEATQIAEGRILWGQVFHTSDGIFHRVWLQEEATVMSVWHQVSTDGGETWAQPNNLRISNSIPAITGLTDSVGRLHLVEVTDDSNRRPVLTHLTWQNGVWASGTSLALPSNLSVEPGILAAAFTVQEVLGVSYVASTNDTTLAGWPVDVYFARRVVETALPTSTPQATQPMITEVPPTPTPLPPTATLPPASPTPVVSPTAGDGQGSGAPGDVTPWIGPLLTILLLLAAGTAFLLIRWLRTKM